MVPSMSPMAVMLLPSASDRLSTTPAGLSGAAWMRMKMLAVVQFWRTVHRLSSVKVVAVVPALTT